LTDYYAQDAKTVFYKHKPLTTSHLKPFLVLQSGYAKDARQVFYEGNVLKQADATSFALVDNESERDAADSHYSYKEGQRIKPE